MDMQNSGARPFKEIRKRVNFPNVLKTEKTDML